LPENPKVNYSWPPKQSNEPNNLTHTGRVKTQKLSDILASVSAPRHTASLSRDQRLVNPKGMPGGAPMRGSASVEVTGQMHQEMD